MTVRKPFADTYSLTREGSIANHSHMQLQKGEVAIKFVGEMLLRYRPRMKATIWHNPDCGTSRKTLAILNETPGIEVEIIDYRKTPFARDKLEQLFRDAGLSPREALRTRGSPAEELGLIDGASAAAIMDAMVEHPILVERPFVETGKGVRLCRPQEKVMEIL